MEMMRKLSHFIENYSGAFFVGNLLTEEVVYLNKKAEFMFDVSLEDCNFSKILGVTDERIQQMLNLTLDVDTTSLIYNHIVKNAKGEDVLVDIQVGYFNEDNTEVFLELIPQKDIRMQMALHQVDNSKRPEAILNIDERLSIVHCNDPFHEVFDSNEELRHSHFHNDLVNGFLPELRQKLINDILLALKTESTYSTKIKLFSATGEEYWYLFELEKRALDNSGEDKVICYMTNIEKQVELEENFDYLNQFFKAVQNFTDDIVYRIDLDTLTLHHQIPKIQLNYKIQSFGEVIPDYMNTLLDKNIIHPDDHKIYKEFVCENFKGNRRECKIRFAMIGTEYKWYSIKGYNIYNESGNLSKIIGTLVNIDEEKKAKDDNSYLNKYLSIMQETTTDILYRVDVETATLHHYNETPNTESSCPQPIFSDKSIPNYIQTFLEQDIIHPDDKATYLKGIEVFNNTGESIDEPVRFSIYKNEYKWYKVKGKKICDEEGQLIEVVGALVDVDKERKIQEEADTLNNYFDALELISGESFYIIDVKNKILTQRGKVAEELGIKGSLPNFPESAFDIVHPDDLENFIEYNAKSCKGIPSHVQMRVLTPAGEHNWYELYSQVIYNTQGEVTEVFGKMNNIHDEKTMSEEFSMLYQYFDALQDLTDDKIFRIDLKNKLFRYTNNSNENKTMSFKDDDFIEQMIKIGLILEDDIHSHKQQFENMMNGETSAENRIQTKIDGNLQWHILKTKLITNENGEPIEVFGKLENIQEKVELEQKANFDKLTGVLSRENFENKIIEELENRNEDEKGALIFIDIDDFKFINDNYGHSYGDFILQKFAKRVGNCIKNTDLMGRVGGDEFVVYLKNITDSETALERANTMLERMQRPISDRNITHTLGLSIGIAITPNNGTDLGTLYENADKAVYESKKRGKNTATLYSSDM